MHEEEDDDKYEEDTEDMIEIPSTAISIVIKLKILAFRYKLHQMNQTNTKKLIQIYSRSNLCNYNSFRGTLTTLLSYMPSDTNVNREYITNQTLYELLQLVNIEMSSSKLLNYAQLLIDLIANAEKLIEKTGTETLEFIVFSRVCSRDKGYPFTLYGCIK